MYKRLTYLTIALILILVCISMIPAAQGSQLWNGGRTMIATTPAGASAAVVSGRCVLYGLILATDGTNAATVNVYDSATAAGTKLIPTDTVLAGATRYHYISFPTPIYCATGVYVAVSVAGGGTCSFQVYYDQ